jgi:hypothetical protein
MAKTDKYTHTMGVEEDEDHPPSIFIYFLFIIF